jgi:glycosyltransferase involved in cell wall biosynthesis
LKKPVQKSLLFDVVVPAYANPRQLRACLDGLKRQTLRSFRVLLCVDGPFEKAGAFLRHTRYPFQLKVLSHPGGLRQGPAATRNLSLRHLAAPYLWLMDSDVVPCFRCLESHLEFIGNRDILSQGRITITNAETDPIAGYLMKRGAGKSAHGTEIPGYYLNTQNAALKTSHFTSLRGFDRDFGLCYGGDDTELGYRLEQQEGLTCFVNGNACVSVVEHKTVPLFLDQMRSFGAYNLHLIRRKHPGFTGLFGVRWYETPSAAGKAARLLIKSPLAEKLERLVPDVPPFLSRGLIHALVFLNMGKGYIHSEQKGLK